MTWYDMHCHMGFADDIRTLARNADASDIAAFCVTVEPSEFIRLQTELEMQKQFRVGLGLHPWWVADGHIDQTALAEFEELAPQTTFIGEIGLDLFGQRGKEPARTQQKHAFEQALHACECGNEHKLISLHAVHAATEVLNNLDRLQITQQHSCIFHRFSGSLEELKRACKLGCFFSVNPAMLQTKRGTAAIRNIPIDRLLIESDKPAFAGDAWNAQMWLCDLENTFSKLVEIREEDSTYLKEHIAITSAELLGSDQYGN